jgi:hypothetical protein
LDFDQQVRYHSYWFLDHWMLTPVTLRPSLVRLDENAMLASMSSQDVREPLGGVKHSITVRWLVKIYILHNLIINGIANKLSIFGRPLFVKTYFTQRTSAQSPCQTSV